MSEDIPSRGRGPMSPLSTVRVLAPIVIGATLFSRALLPGVRGAVVGISDAIDSADSALGVAAQFSAVALLSVMVGLTVQLVRARVPLLLRLASVFLVGLSFFGALGSMVIPRAPTLVIAATTTTCCLLAIILGLSALRRVEVGFVALTAVLAGVASLTRGIGAVVAELAAEAAVDQASITGAYAFARILATASLALALGSVAVAATFLARRARAGARVMFVVIAALVVLLVWRTTQAPDDLDAVVVVVARRAVQALSTRPPPLLPEIVPGLLALLGPVVAVAALASTRVPGALRAAIALSVLAGDAADIPVLGLALAAGALAMAVYADDPRGVFAALRRAEVSLPQRSS